MKSQVGAGKHPFFRTMVLMGSSIALGCGGNARDSTGSGHSTDDPPGGGGGNGGSGSAGLSAEAGGSTSFGGEPVIMAAGGAYPTSGGGGTGGMTAAGGSGAGGILFSSGGRGAGGLVASTGGAAAGGLGSTLPCPSPQWICPAFTSVCQHGGISVELLKDCTCDPSRPLANDECPNGQVSTCRVFTYTTDDADITPPIPYDCSCTKPAETCAATCTTRFDVRPEGRSVCVDSPDNYLCSCAIITLR